MRQFYTFLYWLVLPFILGRLIWRAFKQPDYLKRIHERFGSYPIKLKESIWVHAVSVGESIAAIPLVEALLISYPHIPILMTTTTPTGAARINAALQNRVTQVYLPYDLPFAMQRLVDAMNPKIGIIMETEWWPNLLYICHKNKLPICLFNARLSEKSARGYQKIASFSHLMLSHMVAITAQSEDDAKRLIMLGADREKITITGNIKFDMTVPINLEQQTKYLRSTLGNRPIWIAASTHEGEEKIVLKAHRIICQSKKDALLILVPRHPDRFHAVRNLCEENFKTISRSQHSDRIPKDVAVYLADTMGEMLLLYSVADITFIGGSLVPIGGHNSIEASILAKPILTGPHLDNFKKVSKLLLEANAQMIIHDELSLANIVLDLMNDQDKRKRMGDNAKEVVEHNRGALQKQLTIIKKILTTA